MAKPYNKTPSAIDRVNQYPKTASVDANPGDFLTIVSGYAKRAVSGTTNLLGVSRSTWENDANNTYVPVQEDEFGLWEVDCSTTPVQATHVGNAYDLTDHDTVNLSGTSTKVLTCLGLTPEGRGLFRINRHFGNVGHSIA